MAHGTIFVQFKGLRDDARAFAAKFGEGRVKVPKHNGLSKFREGNLLSVAFFSESQLHSGQELLTRLGYAKELQDVVVPDCLTTEERKARGISPKLQNLPRSSHLYARTVEASRAAALDKAPPKPQTEAAVQVQMFYITARAFVAQAREILGVQFDDLVLSLKNETQGVTFVHASKTAKEPSLKEAA